MRKSSRSLWPSKKDAGKEGGLPAHLTFPSPAALPPLGAGECRLCVPFPIFTCQTEPKQMEYTCIQYDVSDRIASITLNRPEKRNALNARMVQELADAFRAAEEPGIRVVVLKGSGTVFSAGADLASLERLQHNTYEENL